jgi:hypothetical protein
MDIRFLYEPELGDPAEELANFHLVHTEGRTSHLRGRKLQGDQEAPTIRPEKREEMFDVPGPGRKIERDERGPVIDRYDGPHEIRIEIEEIPDQDPDSTTGKLDEGPTEMPVRLDTPLGEELEGGPLTQFHADDLVPRGNQPTHVQ